MYARLKDHWDNGIYFGSEISICRGLGDQNHSLDVMNIENNYIVEYISYSYQRDDKPMDFYLGSLRKTDEHGGVVIETLSNTESTKKRFMDLMRQIGSPISLSYINDSTNYFIE